MAHDVHHSKNSNSILLPASTPTPIIMALGITLLLAGIVTAPQISILGGVLTLVGAIGWFRQVLPHEAHEESPIVPGEIKVTSIRTSVARIELTPEHRARLPLQTFPVSAGIKGGLIGGIAMIIPALLYGAIRYHSIWYAVNLLGGAGIGTWKNPTTADIAAFHPQAVLAACSIHAVSCILVGLFYGAMLPVLPKRPILLGGVLAPILWTGLLHSFLIIINPTLYERIDWLWFLVSQLFFGVVAGWIVSKDSRVLTNQAFPLAVRIGLETPGLHAEEKKEEDR